MSAHPHITPDEQRALAASIATEQRRKLDAQAMTDALDHAEASASWNEYMREEAYRAERYAPTHRDEMNLPVPSCWRLICEEYRENPTVFLFTGLVWLVVLGIGLVLVAVSNGWLS